MSAKDRGVGESDSFVDQLGSEVRTEREFRAKKSEGLASFIATPMRKEEFA